ncbi:Nova1 [Symbiodinium sp. CCMP2592]|nr:Nova1 [Symbiodinium sp. CCMP2592]
MDRAPQVPYRCLVPADAVSFLIGKGGANIRQVGDASGASISISKEGDTPKTLADKIVTIGGTRGSKDAACREVVRKLRQMQGVEEMEPGVFVIIIPQVSAPVVIGSKGAQIKSIMEQSGAEINVGREAIIGMPDQPISVNGTVEQVVSAVSGINSVLQDMVDRGKLDVQKDFQFQAAAGVGAERPMDGYMPAPAQPAAPAPTPAPPAPAPTAAKADSTPWSNTAPTTTTSSAGLNGSAASLPGEKARSGSEEAFMAALQASGINNAQLTILLNKDVVFNVLAPRGLMSEVAQRSGSRIDVGDEGPAGMLQVTLSGEMVGNAMAALLLQEKAIQFQPTH